jgi:hypothetical protein
MIILYINDLPITLNNHAVPILFTDDTSVLITTSNVIDLEKNTIEIIKQLLKWLNSNFLSLN